MTFRAFAFASLFLLGACSSAAPVGPDGSIGRDAALSDGGGLIDTGVRPDARILDAGSIGDAGTRFCLVGECDPSYPDDSCDTTHTCMLAAESASCETAVGGIGPGMECTRVDDCAPGLACFRGESGGRCGRVCCPGVDDACVADQTCGGSGVLVDGTSTSWGTCLPVRSCDLLSPEDDCEPREACYLLVEGAVGHTECRVEGEAPVGAPCTVAEDCAGGLFCGGVPAARRCVRICRVGQDDCLSGEGSCVAVPHTPDGLGLCTEG